MNNQNIASLVNDLQARLKVLEERVEALIKADKAFFDRGTIKKPGCSAEDIFKVLKQDQEDPTFLQQRHNHDQ